MTTHLEETWVTSLTELLRAARSLNDRFPEYARTDYVNGQADPITRVTGLVPPPERGLAGGLYYERIRAAITREATVAAVVRDIERARKSATTTTQRAEDQDADDQQR